MDDYHEGRSLASENKNERLGESTKIPSRLPSKVTPIPSNLTASENSMVRKNEKAEKKRHRNYSAVLGIVEQFPELTEQLNDIYKRCEPYLNTDVQTGNPSAESPSTGNQQTNNQQTNNQQTNNQQTNNQQTNNQQTGDQQTGSQQTDNQQTGSQQTGSQQTNIQSKHVSLPKDASPKSLSSGPNQTIINVILVIGIVSLVGINIYTAVAVRNNNFTSTTASLTQPIQSSKRCSVYKNHLNLRCLDPLAYSFLEI